MENLLKSESQTVEWKREWTDRALEDLAAFANTSGGVLLIGVQDDGKVIGVQANDSEIQRIANIIVDRLGITPSIDILFLEGRAVICITVKPSSYLVSYRGRYLKRVGTTNRDFTQVL